MARPPFKKILIANRGEIAMRVLRTCREMGIISVAVYSEVDRPTLHVRYADEVHCIGPPPSTESYLRIDKVIEVALEHKAEAIHPGYGFLAENPEFARACRDAGIAFIGPTPEALEAMGDKVGARKSMSSVGLPIIPGADPTLKTDKAIISAAKKMGFPVMIKAAAGGGGKGMRIANDAEGMPSLLKAARSEASTAFGDERIFVEKYIPAPRHVEFQILGDEMGNVIHLGERECSIQRRHQKLIEESPSPALTAGLRTQMAEAAVLAAKTANYTNAGTVEFLLDGEGSFYFLEMNTRLQVEHPVTELVTGMDLVKEQILIAGGRKLAYKQSDILHRGHAIECRICAEDPDNNFLPSAGAISRLRHPLGPGVRMDSGIYQGYEVPLYYDPLIAKLVVWAEDRPTAVLRMSRALSEYIIEGVATTIPFHRWVMNHPQFKKGQYNTHFIADHYKPEEIDLTEWESAAAVLCALLTETDTGLSRPTEQVDGQKESYSPWKFAARREMGRRRL